MPYNCWTLQGKLLAADIDWLAQMQFPQVGIFACIVVKNQHTRELISVENM